ncbi:50S ribosomal protein L28 [Schumannella luteola]
MGESAWDASRRLTVADGEIRLDIGGTMAAVCQVTGAVPGFGHNISHSHRRTKRRFDPNVQKKKYYVPSLRRTVTLTLSAKGIKVIDARGIESVVKDLLARGEKI